MMSQGVRFAEAPADAGELDCEQMIEQADDCGPVAFLLMQCDEWSERLFDQRVGPGA